MALDAERTRKLVTEWEVDPTKAEAGIKTVAAEIRKAEKSQRDYETVVKALEKETNSLAEANRNLASSIAGSAGSMALNFAKGNLLANAIGAVKGVLSEAWEETKKYTAAQNILVGSIDQARESVHGMASDLELMQGKNRMHVLGIEMSSAQYGEMAGALYKVSKAMGTDFGESLDKVSTMMARQSDRAAVSMGIVVDSKAAYEKYAESVGKTVEELTKAEKQTVFQAEAMAKLKERAADLEPSVTTVTGTVGEYWNMAKNAVTWTLAWANSLGHLQAAMTDEGEANIKYLKTVEAAAEASRKASELLTQTGFAFDQGDFQGLDATLEKGGGGGEGLFSQLTAGTAAARQKGRGYSNYTPGAKTGRRGGGRKETELERFNRLTGGGDSGLASAAKATYEDMFGGADKAAAAMRRLDSEYQDLIADAARGVMATNAHSKAQIALAKSVDTTGDSMKKMAGGALADLAGGIWSAADAALQGGDSFGMAMTKMLKATLLSIAQQSTVQAVFETAKAFASLAVMDYPGASMHFTSAGIFGGVAALAGGVGLGISAGTAPGSAAGAGAGASSRSSAPGSTPTFGRQQQDNRPVNISVYLGDPTKPDQQMLVTKQISVQLSKAGYSGKWGKA